MYYVLINSSALDVSSYVQPIVGFDPETPLRLRAGRKGSEMAAHSSFHDCPEIIILDCGCT